MTRRPTIIVCARCRQERPHRRRGLCNSCSWHLATHGGIEDYSRINRRSTDTAEDYAELAAQGYSRRHAAERMGISLGALEKALERTRA